MQASLNLQYAHKSYQSNSSNFISYFFSSAKVQGWSPTALLHCWQELPERQSRSKVSIRTSLLLYTALIWSAKNLTLQPCWRVFVLL